FVLLVEGNMDVIAASQTGIKNAVAVSGTALTPEQIKIIKRYSKKVKMFFDMDSAGYEATKKSVKLCLSSDMEVEVVKIPRGKDAADMARVDPEKLKSAVDQSKNAIEYLLDENIKKGNIKNSGDQRKISEMMVDIIVNISNAIERSHWIKKIAEKLETTETALTDALKKVTLKNRTKKLETKEEDFLVRTKMEILIDELIGLILANPDVWKLAASERSLFNELPKDSLLSEILKNSKSVQFKQENLINSLESAQKIRAEALYFQKKFRLGLNNELEEIRLTSPVGDYKKLIFDIKKEQNRIRLEKITADLKAAEEKKDDEAIKLLRQELAKIIAESQQIS
ncbi:MAG TPA: toprim domain-containing protein, partial [Patescibacteria group bacterium]|nr:toprim domain-containing protein [Patescibacteria group bacterium]